MGGRCDVYPPPDRVSVLSRAAGCLVSESDRLGTVAAAGCATDLRGAESRRIGGDGLETIQDTQRQEI